MHAGYHRSHRRCSSTSIIRYFKCPDCGQTMTASKRFDTGLSHLKDMYCPICRCDKKFEQYDSARVCGM